MGLTRGQATRFYDRLGRGRDLQAFHEDRTINELISHASFATARSVFELGCGTGRLVEKLPDHYLPVDATYLGVEIHDTPAGPSRTRLQRFGGRAQILLVDGSGPLPGRWRRRSPQSVTERTRAWMTAGRRCPPGPCMPRRFRRRLDGAEPTG